MTHLERLVLKARAIELEARAEAADYYVLSLERIMATAREQLDAVHAASIAQGEARAARIAYEEADGPVT